MKNTIKISPNKSKEKARPADLAVPSLNLSGLLPYEGLWEFEQAAHLLRRTTFGSTYSQIKDAVDNGMESTVSTLLADQLLPAPPINYYYENDPNVAVGESWIEALYPEEDINPAKNARRKSMSAWIMRQMQIGNVSIREKMTLFWHNHFSIEKSTVKDPKFLYKYSTLLRSNALGNFRQLVKDITIDPCMLRYLDGRENTKNSPNENFARELLELFTIGKGPIVAPGDYTNYTEEDVIQLARILTGWWERGYHSKTIDEIYSEFRPTQHDTGSKQLSHRFDNAIIENGDEEEYIHLIDLIFQKEEVARFICRKIYRWFVNFDITDIVEREVIEPMVQILLDNNYEIRPVIEALLKSKHFYYTEICGAIIKNPMDFVFSILRTFEVPLPNEPADWYGALRKLNDFMPSLDMEYFSPPSVAGWKAYYLEPPFYQVWINAVTLRPRMEYVGKLTQNGFNIGGHLFRIDVLQFIKTLDNPSDPIYVIEEISKIIFPEPIHQNQKDYLKEILIPGLPDFEWTVEYNNHIEEPENENIADAVAARLRNLLEAMLSMPEFQLS